MKYLLSLFLVILCSYTFLAAQSIPHIEVPDEIEFAGMELTFTNAAKKIIEKDIAQITKNNKYFQSRLDRANLYFPIIEKVFEEESFPTDFKYLAIQESSLIGDAVSKSNAVGYWQFKKESAVEVGIKVDNKVDERMNIVAASRGAAKYLKRNNQSLDNWVYALLSYNLGLGGVKQHLDEKYKGTKKMTIDENMHWYVTRFLAHKIVYQNTAGNAAKMDSILVEYIDGSNKSMEEIALEKKLDLDKLRHYNKWLKVDKVPDDRIYSVILGIPISQKDMYISQQNSKKEPEVMKVVKTEKYTSAAEIRSTESIAYIVIVNGLKVILAKDGDNAARLAYKGGITREEFLKYNELNSFSDIKTGEFYYLENKKKKAMVLFHTVQHRESLWDIAQNYGVNVKDIRSKNRMEENEAIVPGRILWLKSKRPAKKDIEIVDVPKPVIAVLKDTSENIKRYLTSIEKNIAYVNPVSNSNLIPTKDTLNFKYHTVSTGETLFGIARQYQVSTDSIVHWNSMPDYKIKIGEKLAVARNAKPVETKVTDTIHVVSTGDTTYKIAKLYGVTPQQIQEWNSKPDLTLRIGEKLLIKQTK